MGRPRKGDVFAGRYEILELLGLGGMGSVHLALDRQSGTQVAVKVLTAPSESSDLSAMLLRRFEREIETLRRIDHPDILHYLDHGQHEGAPFLVCEVVSGKTLSEAMPDYQGRPAWVIALGARLAAAFAWGHAKGIVHRDIKPSNIKFTESGEPRILDYGIARWIIPEGTPAGDMTTVDEMTATNVMIGTIPYMSPEQIRGRKVDHRSDIFSLGVLLYELVSGRRPYEGSTIDELITSMEKGSPPGLSPILVEGEQQTGAALEAILGMALRPQLGERFQSMAELGDALDKARAASSALPADATLSILLPPKGGEQAARLHGRDDEIHTLRGVLAYARAGGAMLVLLEGAAGIGKSGLGGEAVRAAHREGFLCLLARAARPDHAQSNLETAPGSRAFTSTPEHQWLERAAEVFPSDEAVRQARAHFPESTEKRSGEAVQANVEVLVNAMDCLAARMPLFLLLDDVDVAPPEALRSFASILGRVRGRGVVALAMIRSDRHPAETREAGLAALLECAPCRPELSGRAVPAPEDQTVELSPGPVGDRAAEAGCVHLSLEPLAAASIDAIAQDLYPGLEIGDAFLAALRERSGGHPAYVLEILQALQDRAGLVRAGATWKLDESVDLPRPASASSRLRERLGEASADEVELLEAAAVLGPSFTAGALGGLLGSSDGLEAALESISRRTRLVVSCGSGSPGVSWRFEPALAREVLREQIDAERRRQLETSAARAIASGLDDGSAPALHAEAARHYLAAGLEEEALAHGIRAGSGLKKVGAVREALAWIEESRRILERRIEGSLSEEQRQRLRDPLAEMELMLGECHYALSEYDPAIEHLDRSRSLSVTAGRDDYQARCLTALAGILLARGDVLQAQRRAKEAERAAKRAGLDASRALALSLQAHAQSRSGEIESAEELWSEAVELLDSLGEAEDAAEAEFRLGNHHLRLDRWDKAEPCYARAAQRLASGRRPLLLASVQNARAAGLILRRRPLQALPILREAAAIFAAAGARHEEARSLHNIGECHYLLGDLEDGRRMLERVIAVRTEIGESALKAGDLHNLAQILFDLGDVAQALDRGSEALTIKRQVEDRGYIPHCLTLIGNIELEIGRTERARAAFTEVVSDFAETRVESLHAAGGLAMSDWLSGAVDAAEKRFRGLLEQLAEIDDPLESLLERQRLHRFFRERGASAAEIREMIPPMPEDAAAAQLPIARLYRALIRAEIARAGEGDAAPDLAEALEVARRLGCVEWAWRIERDLGMLAGAAPEEHRARLDSCAAMIRAQAARIRNEELRRSYLAHPERAAVLLEVEKPPDAA